MRKNSPPLFTFSPFPLFAALKVLAVLLASPSPAVPAEPPGAPPTRAAAGDLQLTGRLSSSLKRAVVLPFPGEILALPAAPGQAVQAGEILARYRLRPEALLQLRRRLSPPQIQKLELKLAEAERGLAAARDKERGLKTLTREKLAASQSLAQAEREVKALGRSQAALAHSLARERELAQEDRRLLASQLGEPLSSGDVPREAALRSPIAGHVLWLHPDLRVGAVLKGEDAVALVGIMNPMLIRARVHELELAKLRPGDEAEVSFESLPGKSFTARLSRLPWSSPALTPEQPPYYEVEFELANSDFLLKEGLKAILLIRKEK